ncbi:MAG: DUF2206 domain-containing protein [Nanobdellota archaeon]
MAKVKFKPVKVKQYASNYNYKGRKSLGQRVRSFFTIPEEDLKEEETRKFEKIKLFRLNRGIIFLSILVFMLIINALIIFDVNFLYLRQILGFLFIILVPGLLIMLCFKIRTVGFWEYLVYTIGLSVAFIMFAGLLVNWELPWLGITDKPLSLWPILISFDIILLLLWAAGWKLNKDLKPFNITVPKLDTINNIFFIIPMAFPLLSILGAFLLNNHGPNILTMIMLGGIAVYVLLLVIFRKRMNENIWPWAILLISISILMMGWMRSWFVSGVDINMEYALFRLTQEKAFWSISNFNSTYNAMLSVTILPKILYLFININNHFIFKIFFPLIFMFVPLIIYTTSKKYFNNILCFLATIFFISQSAFITWMEIPIRQEIAFLFFSLMLLILFTKNIHSTLKKTLFVIFGVSMIVSHYSTAYIALAIFTLAYIITIIYKIYEENKIKKGRLSSSQKSEFYLTGILILLLLLFGFLWYSQVTTTANGLIDFAGKSISNFGKIFSEDVQAEGRTPFSQFNIFFSPTNQNDILNEYIKETEKIYGSGLQDNISLHDQPHLSIPKTLKTNVNYSILNKIYLLEEIMKKLMKIFILLGFLSILFINTKNKNIDNNYMTLMIASFLLFGFMIFLPFISIKYDLLRTYQQFLVFISITAILGSLFIFKFLENKNKIIITSIFILLFFLFMGGFISQLAGGNKISMRLNNFGVENEMLYSNNVEILSGNWLSRNTNYINNVYVDNRGEQKLYLSTIKLKLNKDIFPSIINNKDYVYVSYTNMNEEVTFKSFNGFLLYYNFPMQFINRNKDKIYNNGGSEIFK